MIEKLKDTIQDCNLNFLIGSGLSRPFLPTLGDIEALLTELQDRNNINADTKKLIRASLYKKYFDSVIKDNVKVLASDVATQEVRDNYQTFVRMINSLLLKRKTTILSKEVNLFTTNVDIFLDKSLEDLNLEYNDGFNGRFMPKYSLSNFKKSHFKKSLHYDNTAELPVFNLLKLHGSLSWAIGNSEIIFSRDLGHVKEIESKIISPDHILDVPDDATINSLIVAAAGKTPDASSEAFVEAYEKLLIVVNPTKEKFKYTVMNQTYYELLRLYSNELEKENTMLFVMGFSFADEHVREITLRAANSNPTLIIYIIAHSTKAMAEIEARFGKLNIKNNNIEIIAPEQDIAKKGDKFYNFAIINKEIFGRLLEKVDSEEGPVAVAGEQASEPEPDGTA
ncbi:MAG: hypothetical protein ACYDHY_14425 [Acidiferrobacterales bacterium]